MTVARSMRPAIQIICVLSGAAWASSAFVRVSARVGGFAFQLRHGLFAVYPFDDSGDDLPFVSIDAATVGGDLRERLGLRVPPLLERSTACTAPPFALQLPAWFIFATAAALSFVAPRRPAQRNQNLAFCACGYDLTGNKSGICPECGATAPCGRGSV